MSEWLSVPEHLLPEKAWAFAAQHPDEEVRLCIEALCWRLKGNLEWIESQRKKTTEI